MLLATSYNFRSEKRKCCWQQVIVPIHKTENVACKIDHNFQTQKEQKKFTFITFQLRSLLLEWERKRGQDKSSTAILSLTQEGWGSILATSGTHVSNSNKWHCSVLPMQRKFTGKMFKTMPYGGICQHLLNSHIFQSFKLPTSSKFHVPCFSGCSPITIYFSYSQTHREEHSLCSW